MPFNGRRRVCITPLGSHQLGFLNKTLQTRSPHRCQLQELIRHFLQTLQYFLKSASKLLLARLETSCGLLQAK